MPVAYQMETATAIASLAGWTWIVPRGKKERRGIDRKEKKRKRKKESNEQKLTLIANKGYFSLFPFKLRDTEKML
jgi:hypothetical protein